MRARSIAAWANARLELARTMSDRDDILKTIGDGIRTWTIGPGGISADGDEDTNNLLRVLNAHPTLSQLAAFQPDPEVEARKQMMLDIINSYAAGSPPRAEVSGPSQPVGLPPNPMRMSHALKLYKEACVAEGISPKTVVEKGVLLTKLAAHVAASLTGEPDPFVHSIGTHHLSSFLDATATKTAKDGTATSEAASPRTQMKKISSLRAFFAWASEQRQATVTDPAAALDKRDKALRKVAAKSKDSYEPFTDAELKQVFDPVRYLRFNNQADYFWAPLLGLHLGVRLKEIVTLELRNIRQHEPTGIWFMEVTSENAKNRNSARRIPIPSRLKELGFIEYVERMRQLGAVQLFPHRDLTHATVEVDPSGNCSERFRLYLQSLGLKRPGLVFHSFRHTVVTALQDAGTPLADSMQITGHRAQEHAIRNEGLSAGHARSVHLKTYMHADKARMNTEFPLARLHQWLDLALQNVPLDYPRFRRAASIVTEHVVKTTAGFESGWSTLRRQYGEEQLQRLNAE